MLNDSQKRKLKSLSHHLKPVVLVGKRGVTESLIKEIDAALLAHELIKVKFLESASESLSSQIDSLAESLDADLIDNRGHIVTFYRRNNEKPKIEI